ncbi:MAG: sulfotransferase domain-containing protein [Opitutales bacterium]
MCEFVPDFLILGAQKAGTTALSAYLEQHPEIFIPRNKEPSFFSFKSKHPEYCGPEDWLANRDFVVHQDAYSQLFHPRGPQQIAGEASVTYLYLADTVRNIKYFIPKAKFIVSLRNPAKRAFSAYQHLRRDGREVIGNFSDALEAESERIGKNWETLWHYESVGYYGKQIERYLDVFSRDQFLFLKSEEIFNDPLESLERCFEFLEVDTSFVPDTSFEMNVSGAPKSQRLNDFFNKPNPIKETFKKFIPIKFGRRIKNAIQKKNLEKSESIGEDDYMNLISRYTRDIQLTEQLTGLNLSNWYSQDFDS